MVFLQKIPKTGHFANILSSAPPLSVAAGAKETTTGVGFAGYTYMQDITKEKCDTIPVGTEGRLIDKRDNKVYWVGKIKNSTDNEALCWMTQNLDYDGGTIDGYNGSDAAVLEKSINFGTSISTTNKYYYDAGDYVYTLGSEAKSCSNQSASTGLSGCADKGWKLESDWINSLLDPSWTVTYDNNFYSVTSYTSIDGKMICTKQENSWLGDMTSSYIPCRIYSYWYVLEYEHYLAGNYYNWPAATNGTGNSIVGSDKNASGSICPTGWSLPLGGNNNNNGSFYNFVNGLNTANITASPYYFVYGGKVDGSALSGAGSQGQYWSSTAFAPSSIPNTAYYAYMSQITGSGVTAASFGYRYAGLSVRCVAR